MRKNPYTAIPRFYTSYVNFMVFPNPFRYGSLLYEPYMATILNEWPASLCLEVDHPATVE